ncbi:MAG: hypothetical protein ABI321_09320 [Polyangia bacterium]
MNISLVKILGSAILATSLIACGGGGGKKASTDMAVKGGDAGVKPDGGGGACTTYGAWATDQGGAYEGEGDLKGYDYEEGAYGYQAGTGMLADVLEYDFYQVTGSPPATTPTTLDLSKIKSYKDCTDCLYVYKDVDPNDSASGTFFFADSGSISVTKRDHGTPTGTVAVASTTPTHFVEYDQMADAPKANGACLTVSAFTFSYDYDNTADADGGSDM